MGVARGGGEPPVPRNYREQAEGKGLSVPGAARVLSPVILTAMLGGWDYAPILQKRKWRLRVLMGLAQGPTGRVELILELRLETCRSEVGLSFLFLSLLNLFFNYRRLTTLY